MHALSILFTNVPFAFGLIRAAQTGVDLGTLWVALAALCGALAVVATGKTRGGKAIALARWLPASLWSRPCAR